MISRVFAGLFLLASLPAADPVGSADPGGERVLSLAEALAIARDDNPDVVIRRARVAVAESRKLGSRRAFVPQVSVDATYLRLDDGFGDSLSVEDRDLSPLLSSFALTPLDGYATGVEVVQPLVNVDAWHARRQADAGVDAAGLSLQRALRVVDVTVLTAYYALDAARQRVQATQAGLQAAQRALDRAQAGFEQELVPPVDVASARARVALLRADVEEARAAVVAAEAALRRLLGIDPGRPLRLGDAIPEPERPPGGLPHRDEVLTARRDVRALERNLAAAGFAVRRARAAYLPDLNLYARYNRIRGDRPLDFRAEGWLLAVNLEWRLFAGFGQIAAVREADADERIARARLERLRRQAWSQVQEAHARWSAAVTGWESAREGVDAAEESLALTEARYAEGLDDMSRLLQAQAEATAARVREIATRYRAVVAAARFRLAADGASVTGRGAR